MRLLFLVSGLPDQVGQRQVRWETDSDMYSIRRLLFFFDPGINESHHRQSRYG